MKIIQIKKKTVTLELPIELFDILVNYHPEPQRLYLDVESEISNNREFPVNLVIKAKKK